MIKHSYYSKPYTIIRLRFFISFILLLLILTPIAPTNAQEPIPPSPANGETLWGENCLPCHGQTGAGDGPTSAQIPDPIPDFTDPTYIRDIVPADYFDIIQNGRIEKMMPPWKNRFEDPQLWDFTAQVLLLSVSSQELATGQTIYTEQCATCHGDTGIGDGPQASSSLTDFSDWSHMSQQSLSDLQVSYSNASEHETLADPDLWAVLNHIRTLAFLMPRFDGILTGQVINQTTGEILPNFDIELHILQGHSEIDSQTGTTDSEGRFVFENLSTNPAIDYAIEGQYQDIFYISPEPVAFQTNSEATLDLKVYDTTIDGSTVFINQLHYLISFTSNSLEIIQIFVLGNQGEATYIGADGDTFTFDLPAKTENATIQNDTTGERFTQTDTGYIDTEPIIPGEESASVVVRYFIPMEDGSVTFDTPLSVDVASVSVLIPNVGATLTSDHLQFRTNRQIQGDTYQVYSGAELSAGTSLTMQFDNLDQLTMAPPMASGTTTVTPPSDGLFDQETLRWILLGVGLLTIVLAVVIYPTMRPAKQNEATRREWLLLMLAQLDEAFEAGDLNEQLYHQKRAEYKAELVTLIEA